MKIELKSADFKYLYRLCNKVFVKGSGYGDTIRKITNNQNFNLSATGMNIWENTVAWVAHDGDNMNDLYFYDGNNINKLTTTDNNLARSEEHTSELQSQR